MVKKSYYVRETNAARAKRQLKTLELRQLEDILVLTGSNKRKAGSKPHKHKLITTTSEAYEYIRVTKNVPTGSLAD
jgi:hypothetical protein